MSGTDGTTPVTWLCVEVKHWPNAIAQNDQDTKPQCTEYDEYQTGTEVIHALLTLFQCKI